MIVTKSRFGVALAVAVIATCISNWSICAEHRQPTNSTSTMIKAAQKAYDATSKSYDAGRSDVEDVYVWSQRLMEAEHASATSDKDRSSATRRHVEDMRALHEKVKALYDKGQKRGAPESYFATEYYLAEAERLVAK